MTQRKFKFILRMIVIALVLVGMLIIYILVNRWIESKNKETVITQGIVDKAESLSGETVKEGLREIGILDTQEYYFTHVEKYDSSREINGFEIPFTQSNFVYSYDGVIIAGIDFNDIDVVSDDNRKIVTVTIPRAKIHSSSIDPDSFKLYDSKNSIFNPVSVTNVTDSFAALLKDEEAKAIEKGILAKAQKNAEDMVENFVEGVLPDYKVIIATVEDTQK